MTPHEPWTSPNPSSVDDRRGFGMADGGWAMADGMDSKKRQRFSIRHSSNHADRLELLADHFLAIRAEPVLQDCGIHGAEIGRVFEVAGVEVGERRICAVQPTLDFA